MGISRTYSAVEAALSLLGQGRRGSVTLAAALQGLLGMTFLVMPILIAIRSQNLTEMGGSEMRELLSTYTAMTEHAVVIAGGGPTGLMFAGELALAGVDVPIVEQRMGPTSPERDPQPLRSLPEIPHRFRERSKNDANDREALQ